MLKVMIVAHFVFLLIEEILVFGCQILFCCLYIKLYTKAGSVPNFNMTIFYDRIRHSI